MADKIVVLNAGGIEQYGSPLELYEHPANIFVAGFIGSPKTIRVRRGRQQVRRTHRRCQARTSEDRQNRARAGPGPSRSPSTSAAIPSSMSMAASSECSRVATSANWT